MREEDYTKHERRVVTQRIGVKSEPEKFEDELDRRKKFVGSMQLEGMLLTMRVDQAVNMLRDNIWEHGNPWGPVPEAVDQLMDFWVRDIAMGLTGKEWEPRREEQ